MMGPDGATGINSHWHGYPLTRSDYRLRTLSWHQPEHGFVIFRSCQKGPVRVEGKNGEAGLEDNAFEAGFHEIS
jgi:hypothetical protein